MSSEEQSQPVTPTTPPPSPPPSPTRPRVRALSLLSGGLDSQLAICMLKAQGIHVEAITFESPFFDIRAARKAAYALKTDLHIIDFTQDILELIKKPKHGFGSCMNPCIDCHARMIQRAGEKMKKMGFDFIATGEVLAQRPMSQQRRGLAMVSKDSGFADFLLRPLSAKLLDPTPMELDGRVNRDKLLALVGRTRKPQMALAKFFGVEDYPSPAGGCKLTEPNFAKRLKDLKVHEGFEDIRLIELLKAGRHIRLPDGGRAVVGRSKMDNDMIRSSVFPDDTLINTPGLPGALVLLLSGASEADKQIAMQLCVTYSDIGNADKANVRLRCNTMTSEHLVSPMPREDVKKMMV